MLEVDVTAIDPMNRSALSRYFHEDKSRTSVAGCVQQQGAHCSVLTISAATNAEVTAECVRGFEQLFASGALCMISPRVCFLCMRTFFLLQQNWQQ